MSDSDNSQVFYITIASMACGFLLALGRQMYKSKCKEIHCCCVHIVRDVESEEKIDEIQLQTQPHNSANSLENSIVSHSNPV